jgi:hypothetical protein
MYPSVTNDTGSGAVATKSIESYSYAEDVTSLDPSEISGGTGQVNFIAPARSEDKLGNTHPNSNLLINNTMTLTDDARGSIRFQVKQTSNTDGFISVTGDTVQSRLNVERTAKMHGGDTGNLLTAIQYYCELVGVTPVIDGPLSTELQEIPVNFIGWRGNVWEHLKMLCAGVSLSETENIGLEMYVDVDELVFRKAKQEVAAYDQEVETASLNVNAYEAAEEVTISNYNTSYKANGIVRDTSDTVQVMGYNPKNVSIADSMQVEAGDTITKRFTVNASLDSVNQPVCVSTITPYPYTGITGQYVVVGTDNLPISPTQWNSLGGNVTVGLTENPNEIEITITAPPVSSIEKAAGGQGLAPYKIGIEEADGSEYPAFYITGTGVFFDKKNIVFKTGASSSLTSRSEVSAIDNPFITKRSDLAIRGIAAAQKICGPSVQLTETVVKQLPFGSTPGTMRTLDSNRFRITAAQYSADGTSITANASASISDFNSVWSGKTFANFKSTALDPDVYFSDTLKFNEFTIIPLMKSV